MGGEGSEENDPGQVEQLQRSWGGGVGVTYQVYLNNREASVAGTETREEE